MTTELAIGFAMRPQWNAGRVVAAASSRIMPAYKLTSTVGPAPGFGSTVEAHAPASSPVSLCQCTSACHASPPRVCVTPRNT